MDLLTLLPASQNIGTIRTKKPTLYVFSGGNEDAAFFSTNGFSLLLDGGDQAAAPFWNLIRNYDKVSAVLTTRMSPESLRGISTIMSRKAVQQCHPYIGAFLGNLPPRTAVNSDTDVAGMIRGIYSGLQAEELRPIEALANNKMEPITLYEVVGEGALRMIVLNPERGSKELNSLVAALKAGENAEKFSVSTCLAVLLVWHPADHSKPTIRILYPGACPLEKLYSALEKLKTEEYLRHVEYINANRELYSSDLSLNARSGHASGASRATVSASSAYRPPVNSRAVPGPPNKATPRAAPSKPVAAAPSRTSGAKTISQGTLHTTKGPPSAEATPKKVTKRPVASAAALHPAGAGQKKPVASFGKRPGNETKAPANGGPKASGNGPKALGSKPLIGNKPSGVANGKAKSKLGPVIGAGGAAGGKQSDNLDSKTEERKSMEADSTKGESEKPKSPSSIPKDPPPQHSNNRGLLDSTEKVLELGNLKMGTTDDNIQDTPLLDSTPAETLAPPMQLPELGKTDISKSAAPEDTTTGGFMAGIPWHEGASPVAEGFAQSMSNDTLLDDSVAEMRKKSEAGARVSSGGSKDSSPLDNFGFSQEAIGSTGSDSQGAGNILFGSGIVESNTSAAVDNRAAQLSPADVQREVPNAASFASGSFIGDMSHDSVNAEIGRTELDEVIESLAGESEQEDLPKIAAAVGVEEVQLPEHLKQNGSADLFYAQQVIEDAHAHEQHLPPVTVGPGGRYSRAPTVGTTIKPKLSQPLYFDVVFVPHHGPHPGLQDEAAAKAFAASVRSRRYVISGRDAIKTHILDGLIAGKNMWNKPDVEIDVLPTHCSDVLSAYNHLKAAEMSEAAVTLRASVDRCTLRLSSGGSDDLCAAFKFEM